MRFSYSETVVATASREDLVALLYDGARRFTDQAAAALDQRNYLEVSRCVGRAQDILQHLTDTLDVAAGGDVAANLLHLYDYWYRRLNDGLVRKDATAFTEVSNYLSEFHAAWQEAARQVRAERAQRAAAGGR